MYLSFHYFSTFPSSAPSPFSCPSPLQRKLARTIKRARHLGFLSFTRGPDDLNNIGPPDFNDMWREHGDFYSPTHRESDLDQAINQSAAGADPRLDEFGQIRQPWQLPAPGARHEALPDAPAARLGTLVANIYTEINNNIRVVGARLVLALCILSRALQ